MSSRPADSQAIGYTRLAMTPRPRRVFSSIFTPASVQEAIKLFQSEGAGRLSASSDSVGASIRHMTEWEPGLQYQRLEAIVDLFARRAGISTDLAIATYEDLRSATRSACESLLETSVYDRVRRFPGFQEKLARLLDQLFASGASDQELQTAARSFDGEIRIRIEELSELRRQVLATLMVFGCEPLAIRMRRCFSKTAPFNSRERLFVAIHGDASVAIGPWLDWLESCGVELWLLAEGLGGQNRTRAESLAAGKDRPLERIEKIGAFARAVAAAEHGTSDIDVRLTIAGDRLLECEACMRTIAGIRAEETSLIFARDPSYVEALLWAASRHGVDLNVSRTCVCADIPFISFIFKAIEASLEDAPTHFLRLIASNYATAAPPEDPSDVIRPHEVPLNETSAFQNDNLADWEEVRALGGDSRRNWLALAFLFREWAKHEARPAAEWVDDLLDELSRSGSPVELASQTLDARDAAGFRVLAESRDRMIRDLGNLEELVTFAEVLAIFRTWLETTSVHVEGSGVGIPVAVGSDFFGSADHVFVVGMIEGSFPRRRINDAILSDSNRSALANFLGQGMRLPLTIESGESERALFLRACASAKKKLFLSYPTQADEGDNIPAFYLEEAARAAGGRFQVEELRVGAFVPQDQETWTTADRKLAAALEAELPAGSKLSEDGERLVQTPPSKAFTLDSLRDAATCSFRFGLRTQLGVKGPYRNVESLGLSSLADRVRLSTIETEPEALLAVRTALHSAVDRIEHDSMLDKESLHAWADRLTEKIVRLEFESRAYLRLDDAPQTQVAFGEEGLRKDLTIDGVEFTVAGTVGAVAQMGAYDVIRAYGMPRSLATGKSNQYDEVDRIVVAVLFASIRKKGRLSAIEAVGSDGERSLIVLDKDPKLRPPESDGIRLVTLNTSAEGFRPRANESLKAAILRARKHQLETTPGDHCAYCEFGELCRNSAAFGDGEGRGA